MSTPRPIAGGRARDVAVLACALSAGVHAGLVPEHVHESTRLALAFACAAVLAGLVVVALSCWRSTPWPPTAAALVLSCLIGAYVLSRTAGLSPLGAEREALDPVGLLTNAVEAVGLVLAVSLLSQVRTRAGDRPSPRVKP
jgi:CHASE2 domain-containing sensor protein